MKKCIMCGETKTLESFYKDSSRGDGHSYRCKPCAKIHARNFRKSHPDTCREQSHKYYIEHADQVKKRTTEYQKTEKGKAVERASKKKYKEQNPLKKKAHDALNARIKRGTMKRHPCWVCGDTDSQAHHSSYSPDAWLDVVWLCRKHHREAHLAVDL